MIGWYVHHEGTGHLHRARAVCSELGLPVTVLSSLPRPAGWEVPWIQLARDDEAAGGDVRAAGWLHWAPVGHEGLRRRMAAIASWIDSAAPRALVCDVSVEVALLARLHGVPIVYVAMPGDRTDRPHRMAYDLAQELVGCWPPAASRALQVADRDLDARTHLVGGLSRFPVATPGPRRPGPPRVAVLMGGGGHDVSADMLEQARRSTAPWEWTVLDGALGRWREDPFSVLCDADVVITHGGQNAVAEVAAARRPALVIPARRPHGEQHATAAAIRAGPWPAVVRSLWPDHGWSRLLEQVARLDGTDWATWCDGLAASRFARIVATVAGAA